MHGDDEPRGDDYIVSFKSYLRPDRAHQIVRDALHGQRGCATAGAWRVLPRYNAAYRLPSDFALVRLQLTRAHRRRALRALRRHSSVRLISPERRYGPSEPMPSKGLQSHAEQEPSPRHAEAASLSEPAHSPDSCLESGADAAAAYGVGRSGRLGRGRPRADFSFAAKCSSGGGGSGGGSGGGRSGCSSSLGSDGDGGSNASLEPGQGPARRLLFPGHTGNQGRREAAPQITAKLHAEVRTPPPRIRSISNARELGACTHAQPVHSHARTRERCIEQALWRLGHTGAGIRVAIFDTGLGAAHPHLRNVEERTNWTDEETVEDAVGHGSFVAGCNPSCNPCVGGCNPVS